MHDINEIKARMREFLNNEERLIKATDEYLDGNMDMLPDIFGECIPNKRAALGQLRADIYFLVSGVENGNGSKNTQEESIADS